MDYTDQQLFWRSVNTVFSAYFGIVKMSSNPVNKALAWKLFIDLKLFNPLVNKAHNSGFIHI